MILYTHQILKHVHLILYTHDASEQPQTVGSMGDYEENDEKQNEKEKEKEKNEEKEEEEEAE